MKKNLFRIVVLCLVAIALIVMPTACAAQVEEEETESTVEYTDQLGRTVTLDGTPERIVSLAPSNTEILFALGLGDKIVGVTKYCDYPPEATEKPDIGGFSTPNLEEIVALSPDLIVASSRHLEEVIPQLEEKGLTVFGVNPVTFDSILEAITILGEVTGAVDEASQLASDMESSINAITEKVKDIPEEEKPEVFYLTWHDPLKTSGMDSLANEFIVKAGGRNIFGDVNGVQTIDLETLVARNPQVIIAGIGMGTGEDKPLQYLLDESRMASTDAAKNNAIYGVDMDFTGRGGPRIVNGLEMFAKYIHPEIFGNP